MNDIKVTIINGGFGNIYSLSSAVEYLGYRATVTSDFKSIVSSDRIILPGVGAFGNGMKNLKQRDIITALQEAVLDRKINFLGICLGMQLLANNSEEAPGVSGLGWVNGEVRKLKSEGKVLPHIGFDEVEGLTLKHRKDFYFVHSYAFDSIKDDCKIYWSHYGTKFISAITKNNINGVQFHPEKSQSNGLLLLRNFLNTGGIS